MTDSSGGPARVREQTEPFGVPPHAERPIDWSDARGPRRVHQLVRSLPFVCGGFAIIIGVLVLAGWRLGRPEWTSVGYGLPPMNVSGALMAVLAGAALILRAPRHLPRVWSALGWLCAATVLVLAVLTVLDGAFNLDIAVDWLLREFSHPSLRGHRVRASSQTAVVLALLGASLFLINAPSRARRRAGQLLATAASLIPLVAILAYVFGAAELYGPDWLYSYIGMGIPAASALLVLSAGAAAARADEGLLAVLQANDSGGLAARRLATSLVILALVTCGIEAGARFGLYAPPVGSAGIVLLATVAGSAFVLQLSRKLSRLDQAAQDAIHAREEIVGVVAHDLRNPLGSIMMAASLLRELGPSLEGPAQESLAVIERSAHRLNRLMDDLLDMTRIEAGKLSITPMRIDTNQLLSDTVGAQQPLASADGVDLRLVAAEGLPELTGDRDRLLQVFENLIGNAIKFTDRGGQITVEGKAQDGDVVFRISDTGSGIRAEDIPRLFDRFWQGGRTSRHGAGLGLPIVRGIVEAHGGRVWVESTFGRGSTFFFTVPRTK